MIVPVSDNGVVELFNGSPGSVQLIVDIDGFTLAGTPAAAGTIGPVTARIADSRLGLQIPGAVPALGTRRGAGGLPGQRGGGGGGHGDRR